MYICSSVSHSSEVSWVRRRRRHVRVTLFRGAGLVSLKRGSVHLTHRVISNWLPARVTPQLYGGILPYKLCCLT